MTGAWRDGTTATRTGAQLEGLLASVADVQHVQLNVKDDFGAKGDGVTNDTSAIQAALDQARIAGGGVVYVPAGTYMVSGIVIGSYVTLRGAGVGATIIKLIANTVGDLLKTYNFDSLTGTTPVDLDAGGTDVGAVKYHLRDLILDANCANSGPSAGNTVGWVLRSFGVAFTIDHVEFWNGCLGGIYSEWRSTTGGKDMETFVSNFKVKDTAMGNAVYPPTPPQGPGAFGICWNGPHDTFFCNGVVATLNSKVRPENVPFSVGIKTQGPNVQWNGTGQGSGAGFAAGGASGEVFMNVHVWGRYHVGWWPTAQMFCSNCIAEGAFKVNVLMNTGSVWIGGTVYGNGSLYGPEIGFQLGTLVDDPQVGVLASNCSRAVIMGCYLSNWGAGSWPFYFASSAGQNMIKTPVNLGNALMFKGAIFPGADHLEIECHDHANRSLNTQPKYVRFIDGFAIKTKNGPPTLADYGYADFGSVDTSLGFSWMHGAMMMDNLRRTLWVQISGNWYGIKMYGGQTGDGPSDVTAASTITIPDGEDMIRLGGSGLVNSITGTGFGRRATILFNATVTIKDGTGNIHLNGDMVGASGDTLSLVCNGGVSPSWYEVSRSANGG